MNRYGNCPKCGGELEYPEPHTVLLTHPPQIALLCKECGHIEQKFLTQPTVEPVERIEHRKLLKRVEQLEKKVDEILGGNNER